MKATLIIANIHGLYAVDQKTGKPVCLKQAFVAMHHDRIIDYGCGDHHRWSDKDTRIIDASNEIVVPAFIDANVRFCFHLPYGDNVRIHLETMETFYRNGITTVGCTRLPLIASTPFYRLVLRRDDHFRAVDYTCLSRQKLPADFILTTSFDHALRQFYDLMPLASLLYLNQSASAQELLDAITLRPAKLLGLDACGRIRIGAKGDLLVFQAQDLHELFHSFGKKRLHRIIHEGVHIWPHVII